MKRILVIPTILLCFLVCSNLSKADEEQKNKEQGRTNTLLLLTYFFVRYAPACPGLAAIKWTNTAASSQNVGLYTNAICTAAVSGTTVTLAPAQSSTAYSCFAAGSYYSGATAACAANTINYTANKNYTKTFDGTTFSTVLDN